MRISRSLAALAIIGAISTGTSSIFLAAQAVSAAEAAAARAATSAEPEKTGYGYGSKSPTPSRSRTRSSSASASSSSSASPSSGSPSPSGTLPETGLRTGSLFTAGLISVIAGFVLVLSVWIWQARARDDRSGAPQRHSL